MKENEADNYGPSVGSLSPTTPACQSTLSIIKCGFPKRYLEKMPFTQRHISYLDPSEIATVFGHRGLPLSVFFRFLGFH